MTELYSLTEPKMKARDVTVFYGSKKAVDSVSVDVPTEYVVCTQDRMVDPDYQRRQPFPQRMLSSGHSPMLSHPSELTRLLCA